MSFREWLVKKYGGKNSRAGDLAYDVKRDKDFPSTQNRDVILEHLRKRRACCECIEVFKRCWREYAKEISI